MDAESLKADFNEHLATTGEREKLKNWARSKLTENGWRETVTNSCVDTIKAKGFENVTLEELFAAVSSDARAMASSDVKLELIKQLQTQLMAHCTHNTNEHHTSNTSK
jgi:phytoene/squalene synthetase